MLSLDGGGLYGLAQALWLKQLCKHCDWFLDGSDVQVFAGCSSGAINALLLAKHEVPREAVLRGELEAFWTDVGTFTNTDPTGAYFSLFGLSPWFSERDFLQQLERHFGNSRLGELKHHVFISAYNWTGGKPTFREPSAQLPWPFSMFTPDIWSGGGRGGESWGPYYFQNLGVGQDKDTSVYRIADVAYCAATPPGFRKIRGGVGDAASFSANPALSAISNVIQDGARGALFGPMINRAIDEGLDYARSKPELWSKVDAFRELVQRYVWQTGFDKAKAEGRVEEFKLVIGLLVYLLEKYKEVPESLAHLTVLSIGSGQYTPAYWLRDIDLGGLAFSTLPVNPAQGIWYPPTAYSLDPATRSDERICQTLLRERFHRLDPPVLSLPTVVAAFNARFPWLKEGVVQEIHRSVGSAQSQKALSETLAFMKAHWMKLNPGRLFEEWLARSEKPEELVRFIEANRDMYWDLAIYLRYSPLMESRRVAG